MSKYQKKKGKGNSNGNKNVCGDKWVSGSQIAEKTNKSKITISELKTDIISLKEIITGEYNTMVALKTQVEILNTNINGGNKTVSFSSRTNSSL